MKTSRSVRWLLPLVAAGFLTACGEEPEETQDTLLPNRPDDKLIEETGTPDQTTSDPTPQAGTSGAIPGYTPLEDAEAESEPRSSASD